MKFSQFVDVIAAALYNESQVTGKDEFRLGEVLERYGLALNPAWGERLFDDYTFSSRIDARRHIGPLVQQHISLSPDGLRWVEDELGENVVTFLERNGATYTIPANVITDQDGLPITDENGEYITDGTAPAQADTSTVASQEWTGIAARLERDPVAVRRIKQQIDQLDAEVESLNLSNHERAKIKAITEALTKLVESPEPEWKAILELLRSPTLQAVLGLAQIAQLTLNIMFGIG